MMLQNRKPNNAPRKITSPKRPSGVNDFRALCVIHKNITQSSTTIIQQAGETLCKKQQQNNKEMNHSMFSPRIQVAVSGTPTNSAAPTPTHSDNENDSIKEEEQFQSSSDDEENQLDCDGEENVQSNSNSNNNVSKTSLKHIQDHQSMEFPINGECTSLSLSPSGNFLWAGFSDGTLRVFDLTGNFGLEQDAAVASRQKSSLLVASKWCQTYGAVACQIHARGVHTDLITQVGVCDDYVFCGVSRGAMELYAVDFSELEASAQGCITKKENILDYLHVHEKADAKLKGFGACTRLKNRARPTYMLLTGKGIKNIHIWTFQPPLTSREEEEPIWTQLYDTQTNGNTINLLGFYRPPAQNKLLGVSQSDAQKLRLWDLSAEEADRDQIKKRAKRPPYVDVANSQAALGLAAGGFCVCGGPTMYNQLSIVSLDQPKNAFNHTELALPAGDVAEDVGGVRRSSSRRQRRGDLKQVANVASPPEGDLNAGHVLLELDDGTIVQYTMSNTMASDSKLQILQPPTIPALPDDYWKRTICLASSRHHMGALIVAMSLYNPNTQTGKLVLRKLAGTEQEAASLQLAAATASPKALLQTPPPREPALSQPKAPVNPSANSASPETDVGAIKTLCMAPPVTKKSKSSSKTDAERLKAKKEKKKKRKKEKMEEEVLKRRSSDSELKTESRKQHLEESKRSLNMEADSSWKPKDKVKTKKYVSPEMVTPARESSKDVSKNASACEWIVVKKVKVIPLSGERKVKKTAPASSSPSSCVIISSPPSESDQSKQGGDFETPARKNPNSSATVSNADTKTASQTQQVSPDYFVVPTKPAKSTGEMDRFVVSQKQLKMLQPEKKERSKISKQTKLTKEQQEKQDNLKVASVPRKSRPNEASADDMEEEAMDEIAANGADAILEDADDEEEEEVSSVEAAVADATKLLSKKKRPLSTPPASSTDATESKKRKASPTETEIKSPQPRKKFSAEDSPPSREDMHASRVKAEFQRIQDLIAQLPAFVPALLHQEVPLSAPKSIMEAQERERSKLESNHRAAHEMIQRRMLRAAESTIRNAVDFHLSVEEARNELKGTMKSYQEVVHETLQRHRLEAETLVAQQMRARGGLDVPSVEVHFPFQETFRDIEDARRAIEAPRRLPGRPRTG